MLEKGKKALSCVYQLSQKPKHLFHIFPSSYPCHRVTLSCQGRWLEEHQGDRRGGHDGWREYVINYVWPQPSEHLSINQTIQQAGTLCPLSPSWDHITWLWEHICLLSPAALLRLTLWKQLAVETRESLGEHQRQKPGTKGENSQHRT